VRGCGWIDAVTLEDALVQTNRNMIAFDVALGSATLIAPGATLRYLFGHEEPSPETEALFRRCAPIWLTFAAAHTVAARRGRPEDWWALAWLRGTEIATDALFARSPAITRPGAKAGLVLAGIANLAMTLGFARLAERRRGRLASLLSAGRR
jgi:hypothetical protein